MLEKFGTNYIAIRPQECHETSTISNIGSLPTKIAYCVSRTTSNMAASELRAEENLKLSEPVKGT